MTDPRYEVLRVAMRKIAWPIQVLREMAEDQGRELDGHMARVIGFDPHYLVKIAQDAMAAIAVIDPAGVNDRPSLSPQEKRAIPMNNVTDFPTEPKRDLIAEMKGPDNLGCDVVMEGRVIPNMKMYDRRPGRDEIEFSLDDRVMFGFPAAYAWDAVAFAFAAMAVGAGRDPLNFEPSPFAKKIISLGEIGAVSSPSKPE